MNAFDAPLGLHFLQIWKIPGSNGLLRILAVFQAEAIQILHHCTGLLSRIGRHFGPPFGIFAELLAKKVTAF